MRLPSKLPLFPLPSVVLYPQILLPLHIFEPRYRQMVRDLAGGEGLVGMVLMRGGAETTDGRDVYRVGCAGRMIRRVDLDDGCSNILLQGVREFSIREQSFERPYRTGEVEWFPATPTREGLDREIRRRLIAATQELPSQPSDRLRILNDPTLTDEMLVNLLAFALDIPPPEKQSALEAVGVHRRAERLLEILEFHAAEKHLAGPSAPADRSRIH